MKQIRGSRWNCGEISGRWMGPFLASRLLGKSCCSLWWPIITQRYARDKLKHRSETISASSTESLYFFLLSLLNWQEITLTFGEENITMKDTFKRLVIIFQTDLLQVLRDGDKSNTTTLPINPVSHPGYFTTWKEGRLAVGGLLGEIKPQR